MSTRPLEFEAGDTLDTLIHQFTDPFAFFRELIQNSLDAGSARVDVWTEFRPPDAKGESFAILHVDDTGEGMNRQIIDTQLVRLFSSSKEGDLTKIGKFGIGFVSVFALEPKYVVVDTGRDGEYWRVIFYGERVVKALQATSTGKLDLEKDSQFQFYVLDTPVDGTQVQVCKVATEEEFAEIRKRGRKTVVYWCKHCDADIVYDGERINEPFELKAPWSVRHSIPGTEIVLAPSAEEAPFFGFYNRGLTLSEGHEALIPGVQFKIKSRYLEHTLTRDNVLRDENYDKAMATLREAVDGPLRREMFRHAGPDAPDELMGMLVARLAGLPREMEGKKLFAQLHGPPLSLSEVRALTARQAELAWDDAPGPASEALAATGQAVVQWAGPQAAPGRGALLQAAIGKTKLVRASHTWASPRVRTDLPGEWLSLLRDVERLLARAGSPHKQIAAASFGSWIEDRLYLVQERPGELYRENGSTGKRRWWLFGGTARTLVVNVDHPLVRPHFDLRSRHPDLAAYLLAKCLTLDDGLDAATETKLVEAAVALRRNLTGVGE